MAEARLPDDARPGAVHLQVGSLERSLPWYGEVLGLRVLGREGARVELGAAGSEEILVTLQEYPGARPVPRGGRLGLYHFALLLPDRPALGCFLRHLLARGEPFGASDHLVSEALYLRDPDGLGVEVYRDRPRDRWEWQGGELRMATNPLDRTELAAAGGATPWEGAPVGTRIGHVHLHVGDLARANAFYHTSLGLDRVVWSYPGALFLSAGGYHHHLAVNTWAADAGPPEAGEARLLEWELVIPTSDDAGAALDRLAASGAAVERDPEGGWAADPWGTRLRIRAGES